MWKLFVLPVAMFAAACSQPSPTPNQGAVSAASATLTGTGTVASIDAAAGSITLDHDPLEALNWPAMTMQFTVEDPALLESVAVGDRVTFALKSPDQSQTITSITKQ